MEATNRVVAGWILEERLGSGGFGEVWRARRRHVGLHRALKLMPVSSETAFSSWRHEISRLEELSHPNIVRFYDADIVADGGPYDDFAWIATELCHHSLADELGSSGPAAERRTLPSNEVSRLLESMLGALSAAHGSGVVHRDIKPGNILRHQAVGWKLCDFGTARLLPAGEAQAPTAVVGTFPYMSPAAHRGRQDHAADLYALGVTVHEALCGERLHRRGDGMTDSEYIKLILDEPPAISPDMPPEWLDIVAALIGDRGPQSAEALLAHLRSSGRFDPRPAPPAPSPLAPAGPGSDADAAARLTPIDHPQRPPSTGATNVEPATTSPQAQPPAPRPAANPNQTQRYPAGGITSSGSNRLPDRGAQRRERAERHEREHLLGIVALILVSLGVAGALLYQLFPNPLVIGGITGAVLLVLVLLIVLS
jgi:serine/threonine-protein kinase